MCDASGVRVEAGRSLQYNLEGRLGISKIIISRTSVIASRLLK